MTVPTKEAALSIEPMPTGFGATCKHDLREPLTPAQKRAVATAFSDYLFVYFPNAPLSVDQLHDFVLGMGTADSGKGHIATALQAHTGIRVVENAVAGQYGPKSNSELHWHADRFFDPVAAGILNSIVVPPEGGDTSFANMYHALDALPADLREAIEGRSIKQDCLFNDAGEPSIRPPDQVLDDVTTSPGIDVEIVRTHPVSGRRYLYLGSRLNAYIPGLSVADSGALLDRLFAHVDQPRFHYRHAWQPGELLFYDNRCCMHRRESFPPDAERKLYAAVVVASDLI